MPMRVTVSVLALLVAVSSTVIRGAARAGSSLVATAASQRIQNRRADAEHLSRMDDQAMVLRFRRAGLLLRVPVSTSWYYLHRIPAGFRYLRPWARLFLTRLSREYHARFGRRLRITGLLRTVRYQRRLGGWNANAASASGPERSSHLTGATLDISKRFMPAPHRRWMRRVLSQLRDRHVLYAVEEFHQPCFHVMVFRTYEAYVETLTRS